MCIRDSIYIHHWKDANGFILKKKIQDLSKGIKNFVLIKNCLLYTSDAADERSSVDLGGRRIIKKKKNKESCGKTIDDKKKDTNKVMSKVSQILEL